MHSAPIAEAAAHICGLIIGAGVYFASAAFTSNLHTRIKAGMFASAATNLIIGGHINLLAKDFLSLFLLRPFSAYLGAKIFEMAGEAMNAPHPAH